MSETKPEPAVQRSITSAQAIKKMEKELYKDALMRDHNLKRGSKYPPMIIEPFPFERQRLSGQYTDADRALRKQWLQDQILTDREPVHIERWNRRNVFRRLWNAPFNALDRLVSGAGVPPFPAALVRFCLPKIIGSIAVIYAIWTHVKINPRTWETGVGLMAYKPTAFNQRCVPGTPEWEQMQQSGSFYREPTSFYDLGFKERNVLRDENLVTSSPR